MSTRDWQQQDFDRLATLSAADFDELVGSELSLVDHDGDVLTVVAVERHLGNDSTDGHDRGSEPFDVLLSASTDVDLSQGMHAVELTGTGVVPLFLVAGGPIEGGFRYVASFA